MIGNPPMQGESVFGAVDIYFNVHKGLWSLRTRRDVAHKGETLKAGRVIKHARTVSATWGATFIVNKAGHARAVREGQKNVHAFLRTESVVCDLPVAEWMADPATDHGYLSVSYAPTRGPYFYTRHDGAPILRCRCAVMTARVAERPEVRVLPFGAG